MKRLHALFYLLLTFSIFGNAHAQSQEALRQLMQERGEYYFTLTIDNSIEGINLGEICSIDGFKGNKVVCYANQQEYDKLLTLGFEPELQTPPSLLREAEMWEGGDRATYEWNSYLTYEQYVSMMQVFPSQALSDRTCTLIDLGELSTSGHRHLYGVHIYKGEPYGKPRFLYSSTMHGDEVTGMILMLRLIDELCTSTETRIQNLLNDVDIYIFPCNNPDGTYYRGNSTVTGARRYNGNTIDLNRNYKDYFNGDHPVANYSGSSYEDETLWTMAQADELLFTMSANYHGGAEVMNYCWDWVFQDHADMDWWEYVCTEYVQLARQVYSSYMSDTYSDGVTNGATWYSITGSRQDYMNGYGQCREVTVECSSDKTPSASQLPNFWNYNHNSMLALMEQARNGVHGVVYDASTGQTIQGVIVSVLNHDLHNSYVTTHEVGDFHRPIKGGTYTFVFDKEGYARKFVEVTVADDQRVDLTVNLTPTSQTPTECYEQVSPASIESGPYLMGYLNGSSLIMPKHDDRSTSTSVSVSTTSLSVTPTDDGFTLPYDFDRQTIKIAIEPSGTSGQYHILYKGRMLQRSSSSLVWAKPSNASGNGVSLSPYNWYINASGVYYQSGSTKYYLNYSNNSFTTSTSSSNITFYKERECPPAGFSVLASYDHLGGTVTFSNGDITDEQLVGLQGGETITVSVSAKEGYTFNSISATDSNNSPVDLTAEVDGTYTFTMPEADVTVSVTFDAIDYTVNVADNLLHGTLFVNGTTSLCDAHAGETISVTATPDPGFALGTLYYLAEGSTTEVFITGNSFLMPACNVTVYATFAKDCAGEITYERVTEAPDDWSGTYLLVYQSSTSATSGYAFNGSVTGGDAYTTAININGGSTINELGGAAELVVEKIEGSDYYYIKHGSDYWYAETTSLYEGSSLSGTTYQWSLEMSGNYVKIHTAAASNQLYFNTSSGQTYYQRIYPASQNGTNLYLFRKTTSSSAATVSFSPVSGTSLTVGDRTVTLTSSIAGLPIYYTIDGTEPTMSSDHAISPVILRFHEAVTVKAFVYDDPENDGCGVCPTATATFAWFTPGNCYELATSVAAQSYVMGYLDGTTMTMPTLNNSNTVTTTSATVNLTDNGFSAAESLPKVTLTAYQSSGQYYIYYEGHYLAKSNSGNSLTWGNNTSQNGRWYINDNGIYVTQYNRNYYLYYTNGSFQLSTTQQKNLTFYTEVDCPPISSYTITATAEPAEGGTVEGADLYFEGETCTLTATANEGYHFVNWTEGEVILDIESILTFTVEADRTITANFELDVIPPTPYEIIADVNPLDAGVVTGAGAFLAGQTATLTAAANEGYHFVNWTEGEEVVGSESTWSFVVERDRFLVANFAPNQVDQIVNLVEGWNWWTPTVGALLADLEDALGTNGLAIIAKDASVQYDGEAWSGLLENIEPGQMYKILTNGGCSFTLSSPPVEVSVSFTTGSNWFGYIGEEPAEIEAVFNDDFAPFEGDKIISQDGGFAIFNGEAWEGTLPQLVPGRGYVYVSYDETTKTLLFVGLKK